MRISDWSSDVCSSDLHWHTQSCMKDESRRPLYGAYSPAGFTHSLTRDSDARALQRGRQSRTQTRGDKDTHWHTQSCMRDASRRPLYGAYSPAGFTHSLTRDSDARALQRGRQSRTQTRGDKATHWHTHRKSTPLN